jgi:hypothetical protein
MCVRAVTCDNTSIYREERVKGPDALSGYVVCVCVKLAGVAAAKAEAAAAQASASCGTCASTTTTTSKDVYKVLRLEIVLIEALT